ncbi:hypothetical protein EPN90_02810 [Patescibacteria group bacterium]|nr:MAG: hypothetical protein EPN90_02810 [Patescibacteria group bacterium]
MPNQVWDDKKCRPRRLF